MSRQVREAVRIRRREGAAGISNSRGEFNRCHIPRLVIEKEDEESKKTRLEQESKEKERKLRSMDNEDASWKESKVRVLERMERKKRQVDRDRMESISEEDVGERRKPRKRLRYGLMEDDWGEDKGEVVGVEPGEDGQGQEHSATVAPPTPPPTRRRGPGSKFSLRYSSPLITDFFQPATKKARMDSELGDHAEFQEHEWFEEYSMQLLGGDVMPR